MGRVGSQLVHIEMYVNAQEEARLVRLIGQKQLDDMIREMREAGEAYTDKLDEIQVRYQRVAQELAGRKVVQLR